MLAFCLAVFDFSGNQKKTKHCGIVLEVHKDYIIASKGNTNIGNDANVGAVMKRKRKIKLITGACRAMYNMIGVKK